MQSIFRIFAHKLNKIGNDRNGVKKTERKWADETWKTEILIKLNVTNGSKKIIIEETTTSSIIPIYSYDEEATTVGQKSFKIEYETSYNETSGKKTFTHIISCACEASNDQK